MRNISVFAFALAIGIVTWIGRANTQTQTTYTVTDLGTLGGCCSDASGINGNGQVSGTATDVSGDVHAFLWQGGAMTDLGTLGGRYSYGFAINDNGQIAGGSE